ncbi:hypothetical protein [Streptomyces sp. NPDC059862]|uniref:hypothetical protein n=1 Tax=unclassified Streptomyces TaxID=2593676 RepID=UPI00363BB495
MSTDGRTDIIRRHKVSRATLRREQRVTEGNTVIVFVDKRGRMFVADRALTAGEIWFDAPQVMYEVDTGVHHDSFSLELPSSEEAFSFRADIAMSWQVRDPKAAVEARLADVGSIYRPLVQQELRRISRRFAIEDSAGAEDAINAEFVCERLRLPHGLGLLACSVTLGLDSGTQAHIAARTLKKRAKESREQEHEAKLAEADFSAIEEDVAHRLRRRRKQEELELERMHEEHRIALQTMRMEFYDQALQDERYGLIKLRLERSPDDVDGVIELVQRHRQIPWEEARAFLATAIDGGLVGTRDVAGLVYQAAETLTDGMREGGLRPGNRPELQRPASDGDERKYSDAGSVQEAQSERAMPGDAEKGEQDEYPV